MRWPAPTVSVPSKKPIALPEAQADLILAKHGHEGIVEVLSGEKPEEALTRALEVRLGYLTRFINGFREQNAIQKARGGDISMPRNVHRKALREIKQIRSEISEDEVLTASLPDIKPEKVEDVVAKELAVFGISPDVAPLVPVEGLTEEFI